MHALVLDVDDVVNVAPYRWPNVDLIAITAPAPIVGTVYVHPDLRRWIERMTAHVDEIVWNTSWNALAATWLGPAIGLPADLPWIDTPRTAAITWGRSSKLSPVYSRYSSTDRVAVLDDLVGGKDVANFQDLGWLLPDVTGSGNVYLGRGITEDVVDLVENYFRHGTLPTAPDDEHDDDFDLATPDRLKTLTGRLVAPSWKPVENDVPWLSYPGIAEGTACLTAEESQSSGPLPEPPAVLRRYVVGGDRAATRIDHSQFGGRRLRVDRSIDQVAMPSAELDERLDRFVARLRKL